MTSLPRALQPDKRWSGKDEEVEEEDEDRNDEENEIQESDKDLWL